MLMGAKQDRRTPKDVTFCPAWYRRYRAKPINANDNDVALAVAA